jgi:hypothetical protein
LNDYNNHFAGAGTWYDHAFQPFGFCLIMSAVWRQDLIPVLSLAGVLLDALGGLYLAYDLLGGKHGPLRTITKSATYGVMFGSAYGLLLGRWFGLTGLVVSGPALSLEIGRREVRDSHPLIEAVAFGLLRAASFGAAGWLARDAWFGIIFGILSAIGLIAAYMILGPPPTDRSSGFSRVDKGVLRRASFRGASIGLAAVLNGALHKEHDALFYGIEVGLVTGISSGVSVATAPSVEAWVDNLPNRRLGGYGAMLVLIGSLLQTAQYVFPLLGLQTM